MPFFHDDDLTHQNSKKGTVLCRCENCGEAFFRYGDEILYPTRNSKLFPKISEKRIIKACDNNDLKSLEPESDTDFAMLKVYLCDGCLGGLRKSKVAREDNRFDRLVEKTIKIELKPI